MFSSLEGNHITTDLIELLLGSQCNHHLQKWVCCLSRRDKLLMTLCTVQLFLLITRLKISFSGCLLSLAFPLQHWWGCLALACLWLPELRRLSFSGSWAWGFLHHMLLHRDLWELATGRSTWKKVQKSARCHWLQLFYQHILHKAEFTLNIFCCSYIKGLNYAH